MVAMTFRLLRLRIALGLTQAQAASRCGVTPATFGSWETCDSVPVAKSGKLLPMCPLQAWLLEGNREKAVNIVRHVAFSRGSSGYVHEFEAILLPEPGRQVLTDDGWTTVTAIERHGRGVRYVTGSGWLSPYQVRSVK